MSKRVVGVRFKNAGRVYFFNARDLQISLDDGLIVETAYGTEYGEVAFIPREMQDDELVMPLKDVLRIATEDDHITHERNIELSSDAFLICQEKILAHGLDMKLVDVEYSFTGAKITFFFTAEGRVDFRELVKDLASVFKTRIELRQIGVRDEAKMLGGIGSCGRSICCKSFLAEFQPVSIKMAKEQKLSLNPVKISGLCGRLMCCLKYEQDGYECMRKLMPRVGREVLTPDGKGSVLENNAITEKTKVRVALPDGTFDVREYHYSDIRRPSCADEEEEMRAELEAIMRLRDNEAEAEEEFFFVTGVAREEKPPAPAAPAAEHKSQRQHRRPHGNKGAKNPQNRVNKPKTPNQRKKPARPNPKPNQ